MLIQYLISAILLIGLAFFTIESSLFPWIRERTIRSWENYRFLAARSRIDGNFVEAKRCLDAALLEAESLKDPAKIAMIKSDQTKLANQEKLEFNQRKIGDIPELNLVWSSRLDYSRNRKRNENFERWEPFIRVVLQKQTLHAGQDPVRLIRLGDALFDMSQYKSALNNYLKVIDSNMATDNKRLQVCALERVGRAYSALGEYRESKRYLIRAIELHSSAEEIPLKLHLAQVCIDGNEAKQAESICDEVLQTSVSSSPARASNLNPQCLWYAQLLKGIAASRLDHHAEAISLLTKATEHADKLFGPTSPQSLRNREELFQACYEAGRFDDAKTVFRQITTQRQSMGLDSKGRTVTLISYRTAKQYMNIGQTNLAIWLWEWSVEERSKDSGPTSLGVAYRLYYLVRAYRKVGNREKMLDAWRRARAITPNDPTIESPAIQSE